MKNIYLNDLGIINALGCDKLTVSQNLLRPGFTGVAETSTAFYDKALYLGAVKVELPPLTGSYQRYDCSNNRFLAEAYQQIAATVERYKKKYGAHRIGVILGTSTSGIAAGEAAFLYHETHGVFPARYDYVQQEVGGTSKFLAAYAGVTGIQYTLSTACSSSGKAVASAARLIEAGICDAVIVGGSDSLCALTIQGFAALESLSSSICKPFSINRDGITLGEGAALFVMSLDPAEIALTGVGESSDGYHMTTPDPTGLGAKIAIKQALTSANCSADEVGYINLHGTGTEKNDEMESQVMAQLFKTKPYCGSTKALIGHTLGAAAAQELALCWLLLSSEYNAQQRLPAHYWDGKIDPALAEINIINTEVTWEIPRFMSNSFAFGGSNVSLIIEKNKGYDSV